MLPVTLTAHTGWGDPHIDLVVGRGAACPTVRLAPGSGGWWWSWQLPHRRRYLHFRGHVSGGRGRVEPIWRGCGWWWSGNGLGWRLDGPTRGQRGLLCGSSGGRLVGGSLSLLSLLAAHAR